MEGLRWVFGNRYLRWIAASTATFNFFGNIIFAVFLVFAVRELGLGAGVIGLIFAISSIGYLARRPPREPGLAPLRGRPGDRHRRARLRSRCS